MLIIIFYYWHINYKSVFLFGKEVFMKKITTKGRKRTESRVLDFFEIRERKSTIKREIIGGCITFLSMVYILAVNPAMLHNANGGNFLQGMPMGGVFLATALVAAFATTLMGIFANLPYALAPGMGVNAFFTFNVTNTMFKGMDHAWELSLTATIISGIIYFLISITKLRLLIVKVFPVSLKVAIGAGIGFFLAMIGLTDSGIMQSGLTSGHAGLTPFSPVLLHENSAGTLVKFGNLKNPGVALAIITLLIIVVLWALKVPGAIFIGMVFSVIIGIIMHVMGANNTPWISEWKYDDLSTFKDVAGKGWTGFARLGELNGTQWMSFIIAIFTFLFTDFFDTTGTLLAIGTQAKVVDADDVKEAERENNTTASKEYEGYIQVKNYMRNCNAVDSIATISAATLGTSTATTYIESSAGVASGARTGLASVVTGLLFVLSIAIFPVFRLFTGVDGTQRELMPVTGPVLIFVGMLMFTQLFKLETRDFASTATAFVTVLFMIAAYSISSGIAAGIIVYSLIKLAQGKWKHVHPMMFILALVMIGYFISTMWYLYS